MNRAAISIMDNFALMQLGIGNSVIMERNFGNLCKPKLLELINRYSPNVINITFHADKDILLKRFFERDKSKDRHIGHVVNTQYPLNEHTGTMSIESQGITSEQFFKAGEDSGIVGFSVGGESIMVDTTDFSKISFDNITDVIKIKLTN